ncbi:MAG: nucleotidyltransferase family protein [Defluviitaleaceae bacterium]|nr:nucleotidyltransferase family protein [Defluviitaleaceae bacterium]
MKAAGVIVEFNPLHSGHIEHLRETTRLTGREYTIAVMSGNFVQRGEPAICDKWHRTRMALLAGVDIVIEIPVNYVVSGADYFARAGVRLLAATGVVDRLCFGSEAGDLTHIKEAGRVLAHEPDEYKTALKSALAMGHSFAAARGTALAATLKNASPELLTKPNNGLGMEYCKALWQMGQPMEVYTSFRQAGGPSATAIRKVITNGQQTTDAAYAAISQHMPAYVLEIIKNTLRTSELAKLDDYNDIFRYLLFTKDIEMGEGLQHRFRNLAHQHHSLTALLDAVKTKRYTYTRIQRAALGVVLGTHPADLTAYEDAGGPAYIRVLGFRREASNLLGEMTSKATLPVITHGKAMDNLTGLAAKMLAKEFEVGDIYRLAFGKIKGYRHERSMPVVIV